MQQSDSVKSPGVAEKQIGLTLGKFSFGEGAGLQKCGTSFEVLLGRGGSHDHKQSQTSPAMQRTHGKSLFRGVRTDHPAVDHTLACLSCQPVPAKESGVDRNSSRLVDFRPESTFSSDQAGWGGE